MENPHFELLVGSFPLSPPPIEAVAAATSVHVFIH